MVEVHIAYQGELRCAATHMPSGTVLVTDAPTDNHGKGESFSPTDLVATALGSCMMTVMAIVANSMGLDLTGTTVVVKKTMMAKPHRRIASLEVAFNVPHVVDEATQQKLIAAAKSCPVHHSLHADIAMPISFHWA